MKMPIRTWHQNKGHQRTLYGIWMYDTYNMLYTPCARCRVKLCLGTVGFIIITIWQCNTRDYVTKVHEVGTVNHTLIEHDIHVCHYDVTRFRYILRCNIKSHQNPTNLMTAYLMMITGYITIPHLLICIRLTRENCACRLSHTISGWLKVLTITCDYPLVSEAASKETTVLCHVILICVIIKHAE